jgi:hypothetical protein
MMDGSMYGYGFGPTHRLWFIVMVAVVIFPVGRILSRIGILAALVDRNVHPTGQSDCALDSCIHGLARREGRISAQRSLHVAMTGGLQKGDQRSAVDFCCHPRRRAGAPQIDVARHANHLDQPSTNAEEAHTMKVEVRRMQSLIDRAKTKGPRRLAVVGAGQALVLDALLQAMSLGLVQPRLIVTLEK